MLFSVLVEILFSLVVTFELYLVPSRKTARVRLPFWAGDRFKLIRSHFFKDSCFCGKGFNIEVTRVSSRRVFVVG